MTVKPRILLLGAHRWRRQSVVQLARDSGFDPVLLLYESELLPDSLSQTVAPNHVLRQSLSSPRSPKEIADTLSSVGGDWFAVGLDDYVCQFAAELSAFAASPTMRSSAAHETLNKHLLRSRWNRLCAHDGMLHPVPFRFRVYSDVNFTTIIEEIEEGGFSESVPLIVKPDALDASIGIHKVKSWACVQGAIDSLRTELGPLAKHVRPMGINIVPAIIAEHQIPRSKLLHPGAEFSAEFLSARNPNDQTNIHFLVGVTQKYIKPETFVEVAHCFPSETFPSKLRDTLQRVTTQLLDELGVEFCISHWEYIVTEDGKLALVEAQLRPAGDWIMNLVSIATDCNPYRILFDAIKSNDRPRPEFSVKRVAAVFFALPDREIGGSFSLVCREQMRSVRGKDFFVDNELANARVWRKQVQWHSRYLAVITEGKNFGEARIKSERILSQMTLAPRGSSAEADQIHLRLAL
jgi:hypothetical protein